MSVLAIVKLLLSFADGFMRYLNERQLLDAGRHIEKSENLTKAIANVQEANRIRERVRVGQLQDPFIRD